MNENSLLLPSFTVHRYDTIAANLSQTEGGALLQKGAHLIQEFRDNELWHDIFATSKRIPLNTSKSRVYAFTFSEPPPAFSIAPTRPILKNWSEPPAAEEIFSLKELQEFESSDFSDLFRGRGHSSKTGSPPRSGSGVKAIKRSRDDIGQVELDLPPRKLTRQGELRLDTSSLQRVIPQPHIQLLKSPTPLDFSATKSYIRHLPIFLPPNSGFPPSDDFSRRAWIIPARGSLPLLWTETGASSAVVLDPLAPCSSYQLQTTTFTTIKWSHDALKEFWAYLIQLRDLKVLGALGISFHCAPKLDSPSNDDESRHGPAPRSTSLRSCDYFKVYHDAYISMYLRHALDLFPFVDPASSDSEENEGSKSIHQTEHCVPLDGSGSDSEGKKISKTNKYRLLKGARLVLVDERSRGVLIA